MLAYSGKGKFVVEPVDLSRVVEDSRKILDMSISKKAALTCDLAADLPAILADASQMCQIVMNLVINAWRPLGEQTAATAALLDQPRFSANPRTCPESRLARRCRKVPAFACRFPTPAAAWMGIRGPKYSIPSSPRSSRAAD